MACFGTKEGKEQLHAKAVALRRYPGWISLTHARNAERKRLTKVHRPRVFLRFKRCDPLGSHIAKPDLGDNATELLNYPARNRYREKCMPGSYVGPDPFDPCEACTRGEFSDQVDADHCDNCPIGTWSDQLAQKACRPCPEGTTTTVRGARDVEECVCRQGYVNRQTKPGTACEPCPEGATCEGGMRLPVPQEGYWTGDLQRNEVYSCDPPSSCVGGPGRDCQEGHMGRWGSTRFPSVVRIRAVGCVRSAPTATSASFRSAIRAETRQALQPPSPSCCWCGT